MVPKIRPILRDGEMQQHVDLIFWPYLGDGHSVSHWHLRLPFSTERMHVCPHIFDRLPHEVPEYTAAQTGCLKQL